MKLSSGGAPVLRLLAVKLMLVQVPVCIFHSTDTSPTSPSEENKSEDDLSYLFSVFYQQRSDTVLLVRIVIDSFITMQPRIVVMVAAHMMFNGKVDSFFKLLIHVGIYPKSQFPLYIRVGCHQT